jgi:hypothetical protein
MGRRRGKRAGRPPRTAAAVTAAVAVLAGAVATVVLLDEPTGEADPTLASQAPSASPVTGAEPVELDVSRLPIPRAPFCGDLDAAEVGRALDGDIEDASAYGTGDTVRVAPGVRDVAHEYGCRFSGPDAEARVWVFAAPVTRAEARRLVREARAVDGCREIRTGTAYGRPGVTRLCRDGEGSGDGDENEVEVGARGLFGDAWLSCQVTATDRAVEVTRRAERWCVHVATELAAR